MGCKRIFSLKAVDYNSFDIWTSTLDIVIKKSEGFINNLEIRDIDFKIEFWRFDHIDEDKFLRSAETGDLLLFRGKHLGGKLTRKWTNGHSDHAAMIVKLEKF